MKILNVSRLPAMTGSLPPVCMERYPRPAAMSIPPPARFRGNEGLCRASPLGLCRPKAPLLMRCEGVEEAKREGAGLVWIPRRLGNQPFAQGERGGLHPVVLAAELLSRFDLPVVKLRSIPQRKTRKEIPP